MKKMRKKMDLDDRIYKFALTILKLVQQLPNSMVSHETGRQLLRAGTSIAANYEEARGAFSKNDFNYKISIAFKEARETNLWLRLIKDSNLLSGNMLEGILTESEEIRNILGASLKTIRAKDG